MDERATPAVEMHFLLDWVSVMQGESEKVALHTKQDVEKSNCLVCKASKQIYLDLGASLNSPRTLDEVPKGFFSQRKGSFQKTKFVRICYLGSFTVVMSLNPMLGILHALFSIKCSYRSF